MLTFFRPAFKSGIMIIKDKVDGKVVKKMLKPTDNGAKFEFGDEDYILQNYPNWFMDELTYEDKKASLKKSKKERKTIKV